MKDRNEKGRQVQKERHPDYHISPEDLSAIRTRRKSGETLQAIADSYGISKQRVWQLIRGIGCKNLENKA
jgi:predicted DNA-binding protein (UPF0251 family)